MGEKYATTLEEVLALRSRIAALEAENARLREALKDIGMSDEIENCLDPQRNKRVATFTLREIALSNLAEMDSELLGD